jgi:hypothetical protein
MPWLSRVNFIASDTLSFTDVNNLGNDIRAWGDNVNGGGYTLSNVVVSASAGTMPTLSGGSAAGSTLTLRSTSGAGSTDAIIFQTGAQVERARITSGGNVGIGATPGAGLKFDVRGSVSRLYAGGTTTNSTLHIGNSDEGGGQGASFTFHAASSPPYFSINALSQGVSWRNIALADAGSANVGIGTSSPTGKLDVVGGRSFFAAASEVYALGVKHVSTGGAVYFGATNGTASPDVQISNAGGGALMVLLNGGNVGIGTTSPAYQLQLSTDSAAKPSTNTWTIASDSRLKTVNGNYEKGLAEICQIRPVRYEYNGKGGFVADGNEQISIIAQELMCVFPECVGTFKGKLNEADTEEIDLYNYNGHAITFALINAIKQLKAELDAIKKVEVAQ